MKYAELISSVINEETKILKNCHADNAGTGFIEHDHEWDHIVKCTKGSIKIIHGGDTIFLTPNDNEFTMLKGIRHSLEILEDGTEFYTEHPSEPSWTPPWYSQTK